MVSNPFTEWEQLPDLIASVDINLAPITESIFNEAKSENKWVEAALVNLTIASNLGAFKCMITQNENGLLCETQEEWYQALNLLIKHPKEKETTGRVGLSICEKELYYYLYGKTLGRLYSEEVCA